MDYGNAHYEFSGGIDSYNDGFYPAPGGNPYGEQMPGRNSAGSADGRYKYTSKERDTETGYDYFGARYCDSWSARLNSIDPHEDLYPWLSPYVYGGDNPISFLDRTGMDSTDSQNQTNLNQLAPQGPLTLVGPQEIPAGSISANGFSEPPAISRFLGFGSEYLHRVSDVSAIGAIGFIGFGLATGTEEFTAPIGSWLAAFSYYTEATGFAFDVTNYAVFKQGNASEIGRELEEVGVGLAFNIGAYELSKVKNLSEVQKSGEETIGFALDSMFLQGPANPNSRVYIPGPVYVVPDATVQQTQRNY